MLDPFFIGSIRCNTNSLLEIVLHKFGDSVVTFTVFHMRRSEFLVLLPFVYFIDDLVLTETV